MASMCAMLIFFSLAGIAANISSRPALAFS
jgi:hypothetical protein